MRISLLLQREPFPQILEETLCRFWSEQYGRSYSVHWIENGSPALEGAQNWLVNAYLNAIFVPDAQPAGFDPLRREFSRSMVWWKRPLQVTYVDLALKPLFSKRLAQAILQVSPAVPAARQKIIVAGNHKIRLLNQTEGLAYGILKAGFRPLFMQRELSTRQQAAACGVPVPGLAEVAKDETWFSEHYLSGTPINRLPNANEARSAVTQITDSLQRFYQETQRQETVGACLARLETNLGNLLACSPLLVAMRDNLAEQIRALSRLLAQEVDGPLTTVQTHGDFQPANILLNQDGVWLIDWEYAARRQAAYDGLVFNLASRAPGGLAKRLADFVRDGWSQDTAVTTPTTTLTTTAQRLRCAHLFLLEELQLHLEENSQPRLTAPGQGLLTLQKELNMWLRQKRIENKKYEPSHNFS